MKKVVVLLPTYNEKENIAKMVNAILEEEKKLPGYRIEVLIADSDSPDGTGEVAQKIVSKNDRVHYLKVGRGLGTGLIEGHKYSLENLKPDVMAQMDADNQVEADVIVRLVKAIEEGNDLALGSRFINGGKNKLSLSRRIFSRGMSIVCRVVMGPFDIGEFANSARAFTPALFKKINLSRMPWREKTFIIQPAFLHEAILAGAKYKEVPLVFKNRAEGYSKNRVANYVYDVIAYCIDARLHSWGINLPLFFLSRRLRTFFKFGMVGVTATIVDFLFYKLFIGAMGIAPATAKGMSAEVAIIHSFTLNNYWTFRHRKTKTNFWQRMLIFNGVSLGGIAIAVLVVKFLHILYGDGMVNILGRDFAYNTLYFFATIPPVMIWNFSINHFVTFRNKKED